MFRKSYGREFTRLGLLAAPLMVAQVSQMGMGVIDVVITGRYGTVDQAGVALGTSMFWPLTLLMTGILLAVTPTVAQLHGARQTHQTGRVVRQALWLALVLSILLFLIMQNMEPVYRWIGVDPQAVPIAAGFLKAQSYGIFAIAGYLALKNLCEGLGMTLPSMVILVCAFLLKIPLSYSLVFGLGEIEGMGGIGCGVATAIIMWFQLVCVIIAIMITRIRKSGVFSSMEPPDLKTMGNLIKIGFPMGFTIFVEVGFFATVGLLVGKLGINAVASHVIAINVGSIGFMIPLALSMASTIRVGTNVGASRFHAANRTIAVAIVSSFVIAMLIALTLLTARFPIVGLYTDDPAVIPLAASLLLMCALFQLFDASQITALGLLRGFKDTSIPAVLAITSYWLLGMPVGLFFAFGWGDFEGWGVSGFWIGFVLGLISASVLLLIRLRWVSRHASLVVARNQIETLQATA